MIGHDSISDEYTIRLDAGHCNVMCDVRDCVVLPVVDRPPLDVPVGTRARNVRSGVVGTVLGYCDRIGGGRLVYIVANGNSCPGWRDRTLWEVVEGG